MVRVVIPYKEVRAKIENAEPYRARPFLAIMYGCAARVGELVQYRRRDSGRISRGLTLEDIEVNPDHIIINLNNFKNAKEPRKKAILAKKNESWLIAIIKDYVEVSRGNILFDFGRHTALNLVKKWTGYTSHNLRHSRLTHLAQIFGYDAYEIRKTAGHAMLDTSIVYVHVQDSELLRKLQNPVVKEGLK